MTGRLSEPPERFWGASAEAFEQSDCYTLPNALKYFWSECRSALVRPAATR